MVDFVPGTNWDLVLDFSSKVTKRTVQVFVVKYCLPTMAGQ